MSIINSLFTYIMPRGEVPLVDFSGMQLISPGHQAKRSGDFIITN